VPDHSISLPVFHDDGFVTTAAEPWVKQKVRVVQQYLLSFVGKLAGQVDDIFFIDLYAGNGFYSLGAKKEIFPGVGMMALGLEMPISKFIFCEKDADQSRILKIRVNRYFRGKNVVLLEGKPEDLVEKLRMYTPQSKGDYRVAIFCACDPFSLEPGLDTIDQLSAMGFSFLIPFTFSLNDRVNYRFYLTEGGDRTRKFLGGTKDMDRLEKGIGNNVQFYKRLIHIYENNILALGLNTANSVHKLDSGLMEIPFYCVGFFSKQFSTKAIQQDVETLGNVQFELF
jgi:three-Cys-motif partner protein